MLTTILADFCCGAKELQQLDFTKDFLGKGKQSKKRTKTFFLFAILLYPVSYKVL